MVDKGGLEGISMTSLEQEGYQQCWSCSSLCISRRRFWALTLWHWHAGLSQILCLFCLHPPPGSKHVATSFLPIPRVSSTVHLILASGQDTGKRLQTPSPQTHLPRVFGWPLGMQVWKSDLKPFHRWWLTDNWMDREKSPNYFSWSGLTCLLNLSPLLPFSLDVRENWSLLGSRSHEFNILGRKISLLLLRKCCKVENL
jgi:hypothetical protein